MSRGMFLLAAILMAAPMAAHAVDGAAPTAVDGGVEFSFYAPDARTVNLAGEFNGWDPAATPMTDKNGDGVWTVVIPLQTGRSYEYKFVLNGGESWKEDPNNPDTVDDNHGGVNTVVSVNDEGKVILGYLDGGAKVFEPIVGDLPSDGTPIDVAIIWHQHQPKYLRDLKTGEYDEPWVRMHSIKDYYDMVAILDDYPQIHFTVNLTPVLLMQMQDIIDGYKSGGGTDRYMRATLQSAATLTTEDKLFLLTHFFSAQWDNMIEVWPRYSELKAKKGGDSREQLLASAATFSEQDWRDLQAWFNLAWFDPDFQEGDVTLPDGRVVTVKNFIQKGRGFTEEDKRKIIDIQMAIMENVVEKHRELQNRGQLEVITTPFYHPILPLIYDTDLARIASPGLSLPAHRFHRPEDAAYHARAAVDMYERLFGRKPSGMWPAEGAVAQEIVPVVADAGFRWMASDDQILEHSLEGSVSPDKRYQMYWAREGEKSVAMIFRDHRLSDDIGFNFGKMDGVQAANSMMRSLSSIQRQFQSGDGSNVVPIILDGENAWEWYKHDGKEFFHSWYDQMSKASWIHTVTVNEHLDAHEPTGTLSRLYAGSWIGHSFDTWIGEPEENQAWDYLARARADMDSFAQAGGYGAEDLKRAMDEIYAAEGSDWFWWYGDDQTSPLEGSFDEIFRGTLSNAYTILGEEPPSFLSVSILRGSAASSGGGVMARAADASEATLLAGPVKLPDGYLFSIKRPDASSVNVAGSFNGWSTDAAPMSDDDGDGVWTAVLAIEPGTYEYKFAIDGGTVWVADEGNPDSVPDPYGGANSVLVAK